MTRPHTTNIDMIHAWLQRSSKTPLSISLHGFSPDTKSILSILSYHIHRLKEIVCDVSLERLLIELGGYMDRMSATRALTLQRVTYSMVQSSGTNYRVSMPSLEFLRLFNVQPSSPIVPQLPWNQLIVIELWGFDVAQYFDYLRTATNLCSLTLRYYTNEPVPSVRPVHCHLQTLDVLTTYSPRYGADAPILDQSLLDLLTLPNLKNFKGDFRIWPHVGFMSFLSRSGCSLESLDLRSYQPVTVDRTIEILRHVPTLSELRLGERGFGDTGESVLNHIAQASSLVPALASFRMAPIRVPQFQALVPMVLSRLRANDASHPIGSTSLKLLTLDMSRYTHWEDSEREQAQSALEALMRAKTAGLELRLEDARGKEIMVELHSPDV